MKKILLLFTLTFAIFIFNPIEEDSIAKANTEVPLQVFLDTERVWLSNHPVITNNRTLVEFRTIFEYLGLSVGWDQNTFTAIGENEHLKIQLQIWNNTAYINGTPVALDVAPSIINSKTMVPLRFISEATGATVTYEHEARQIDIYSKNYSGGKRKVTWDNWASQFTSKEEVLNKYNELAGQLQYLKSITSRYSKASEEYRANLQEQITVLTKQQALIIRMQTLIAY